MVDNGDSTTLDDAAWLWGYLGYEEHQPWAKRTQANEDAALTMVRTLRKRLTNGRSD